MLKKSIFQKKTKIDNILKHVNQGKGFMKITESTS